MSELVGSRFNALNLLRNNRISGINSVRHLQETIRLFQIARRDRQVCAPDECLDILWRSLKDLFVFGDSLSRRLGITKEQLRKKEPRLDIVLVVNQERSRHRQRLATAGSVLPNNFDPLPCPPDIVRVQNTYFI